MSPEEAIDVKATKDKIAERQAYCLRFCKHVISLSAEQLKHTGFKTVQDAVFDSVKRCLQETEKLQKEYFKRWPDRAEP